MKKNEIKIKELWNQYISNEKIIKVTKLPNMQDQKFKIKKNK